MKAIYLSFFSPIVFIPSIFTLVIIISIVPVLVTLIFIVCILFILILIAIVLIKRRELSGEGQAESVRRRRLGEDDWAARVVRF